MTLITFNVPIVLTAEDNNTTITKKTIMVKDCSSFGDPNDECDGWNFNTCPNDEKYCQPFIHGDKIYGQLKYDSKLYTISGFEIINTATGLDIYNSSFVEIQSVRDALNNLYGNYIIDTGNALFASVTCFYVKYTLSLKQGAGVPIYYSSEPYCVVQCNENTLLILGSYPNGYDCFGGYYGSVSEGVGTVSIYVPQVRIRGVIENDNFDFEKTINNKKTVKSKQYERFLLLSKLLPYYVVRQIAVCFNSKLVTIDGIEYSGTIKLTKNNDEGNMWILRETIFKECDEINFTCD